MKHILLTISLIFGATAVSANNKDFAVGDVFYCQMEAFTKWNWNDRKLKNYILEKFRFSIVDRNTIKFGEQGYLAGKMKIDYLVLNSLRANDDYSIMSIRGGNFSYVQSTSKSSVLIAATCDRF